MKIEHERQTANLCKGKLDSLEHKVRTAKEEKKLAENELAALTKQLVVKELAFEKERRQYDNEISAIKLQMDIKGSST